MAPTHVYKKTSFNISDLALREFDNDVDIPKTPLKRTFSEISNDNSKEDVDMEDEEDTIVDIQQIIDDRKR